MAYLRRTYGQHWACSLDQVRVLRLTRGALEAGHTIASVSVIPRFDQSLKSTLPPESNDGHSLLRHFAACLIRDQLPDDLKAVIDQHEAKLVQLGDEIRKVSEISCSSADWQPCGCNQSERWVFNSKSARLAHPVHQLGEGLFEAGPEL